MSIDENDPPFGRSCLYSKTSLCYVNSFTNIFSAKVHPNKFTVPFGGNLKHGEKVQILK